jgi:hypothetical protein
VRAALLVLPRSGSAVGLAAPIPPTLIAQSSSAFTLAAVCALELSAFIIDLLRLASTCSTSARRPGSRFEPVRHTEI